MDVSEQTTIFVMNKIEGHTTGLKIELRFVV